MASFHPLEISFLWKTESSKIEVKFCGADGTYYWCFSPKRQQGARIVWFTNQCIVSITSGLTNYAEAERKVLIQGM